MTKQLIRSVYLDGVHYGPGSELTDEQAKRVTNPHAYEDLSVAGQNQKPGTDEPGKGEAARKAAAKPAVR